MNIQIVHKLVTRLGIIIVILIATAFSVTVSVLIYMLLAESLGSYSKFGFMVSLVVPGLIAPICTSVMLRLTLALHNAEQKVLKVNEWLESTVAEKTLELRQTNEELQQVIIRQKKAEEERNNMQTLLRRAEKMEALGILAAGVAHDLNNVIGVLIGYSELLLLDLDEKSPYHEYITNIYRSGQRATAIVQDLLTLGRRGISVSDFIDLNSILADLIKSPELKKLQANRSLINFKIDLAPNLLTIKGSAVYLWKTVFNLIINAMEAINNHGEITIRTMNCYIEWPIRGYDNIEPGNYVVLEISDNGKGISSFDLERIFEPFYTRKVMGHGGSGLGLTVVWGTVKDHNGYIDVQSKEGLGSVFTLYFPVVRKMPGEQESLSAEAWNGIGETLLVVDDIEEQRKLATAMLSQLGYRVSTVESGEAAVAFLQEREVDLVILDMIMDPGIDGLETYRRILEIHPEQRAIIVSGFSEMERIRQAEALGAKGYVCKPYSLSSIGRAVRAELDRP